MGWFAERRARKQAAARAAAYAEWKSDDEELRGFLAALDAPASPAAPDGMLMKAGETALLNYQGASLVEPRRQQGHYEGAYSGFSFRVAKGVRYHVGGTRGHYVPGPDVATAIDSGTVTITNQRVVFRGAKQTREWAFAKLVGWTHEPDAPITYLQVSNRQKTSGFAYAPEHTALVHFRLAFALAQFSHKVDDLRASLQQQLAEHQRSQPAALPAERAG